MNGQSWRRLLRARLFDYSPVLQPLLDAADWPQLVVKASRLEEVPARWPGPAPAGVYPLTCRGSGTGNYGQCVPLAGGVVARPQWP